LFDLGGGFLREGCGELRAAQAMLGQPRPDRAQKAGGESGEEIGIDAAQRLEQPHGDAADDRVADALEADGGSARVTCS